MLYRHIIIPGIAHAAKSNQDFLTDMVAFQSANTDRTQSVLQQGEHDSFQIILEYSYALP
jgi:hypothetical protein